MAIYIPKQIREKGDKAVNAYLRKTRREINRQVKETLAMYPDCKTFDELMAAMMGWDIKKP